MAKIDLNCDMGESFGAYTIGADEAAAPYITSANVACGFHAGDPMVMERTVALLKSHGVAIGAHPGFHASDPVTMAKTVKILKENGVAAGAHPGFPDLLGFGRRNLAASPKEAKAYVQYQIGALQAFCKASGSTLQHVKPHGALYNMAGKDGALAKAVCEAVAETDDRLILLCPASSQMHAAAKALGLRTACEVFADRAYEEDGSLVPRTKPGAMITDEDEAIARVIDMVEKGKVRTVTGKEIEIRADSVCVHGDGEKALLFVQKIRSALQAADIELAPLAQII